MTKELDNMINKLVDWFAENRTPKINQKDLDKILNENGFETDEKKGKFSRWIVENKIEFMERLHARMVETAKS